MPSAVDFLRIKWPRLAAVGNEAESLLQVSPTGAIDSMQIFCLWSLDIIAEMLNIDLPSDIHPLEKLDVIDATEKVPTEILNKFAIIFKGGSNTAYRVNISPNEAQTCFDHMIDIGRWMKNEADKHYQLNDPYRGMSPAPAFVGGASGYSGGSDSLVDRLLDFYHRYKQYIFIGAAAVVVIIVAIIIATTIAKNNANKGPDEVVQQPTLFPTVVSTPVVMATPTPTPTVRPETFKALEDLTPSNDTSDFMASGSWQFRSLNGPFTIGGTEYSSGIGLFVASSSISQEQCSNRIEYNLDQKYTALRFDLGADSEHDYGENYGSYNLLIYAENTDGDPIYESGWTQYDGTYMNVDVDVTGVNKLIIRLTERKGSRGTLNIVLGNARLVEAYVEDADVPVVDSPAPSPTPTGMAVPTAPVATPAAT